MGTSTPLRKCHWCTMLCTCAAVLMLQGCSEPPEAREAFEKGWRYARVVETNVGTEPIPHIVKDCRAAFAPGGQRRFAVVAYSDGTRHFIRYVALVPPGLAIHLERVYQININDCSSPWYQVR